MNSIEFFNNIRIFGDAIPPDNMDLDGYIELYSRGLNRYSGDVLDAAFERMLNTRKHRNFPLLAECIDACKEVQEEFAERRLAEKGRDGNGKKADPWSPQRIAQADRMMNSDIGRQAAQEGWIIHLHDWCREQGRLPGNFEMAKVRAKGLAIEAERKRLEADPRSQTLTVLRIVASAKRAIDTKRKRLHEIALGDAP